MLLSTRRFIAAAVDTVLVAALTLSVSVAVRALNGSLNSDVVFVVIAALLVAVECIRFRSIGKFVAGLVVRGIAGGSVGRYEMVLRVAVIAVTFVAARCVVDLFLVYDIAPSHLDAIATYICVFILFLWPISIVASGGRVGLHDVIANTCVTVSAGAQEGYPVTQAYIRNSLGIAAMVAALLGTYLVHVYDTLRQFPIAYPQFIPMGVAFADDLNAIPGHENLIRNITLARRPWSRSDAGQITFYDNADGLGHILELTDRSFNTVLHCEIYTNADGLLSGDFQRRVARILATTLTPGNILNIDFIVTQPLGPIEAQFSKRLLAFNVQSGNKPTPALLVVEPDRKYAVGTGIRFGGLLRGGTTE